MLRRTLILLPLAVIAVASVRAEGIPPVPRTAIATITDESARRHVDALASDAMMGRNTPSPQLDSAAGYIAAELARLGIEPVAGSYFHQLNLKRDDLGEGNAFSVDQKRFALKEDFIPYDFTASGTAGGPVVFLGYGISMPDSGYDDYAGVNVLGKVVLVVAGEPSRFSPMGFSLRTSWFATARQKMLTAARHGAAAILILPNPTTSRLMRPTGYPWPALYRSLPAESSRLRLDLPDSALSIPAISVGGSVARGFFGGSIEKLIGILDVIDSTGVPQTGPLPGFARVNVAIERTLIPARNVVGVLPGRERPDEYIVIGAHYDHVGTRSSGHAHGGAVEDTIFNGADDNASGTAGVLLAARAFTALAPEERPSRSILFVAFTAEELGLFGSRAFVATSPVPTSSMVAMLNMDMVGRNDIDTLSVGGMRRSPELARALDEANGVEPFTILDNIERDFYRSDQAAFARAGVPVLFFHSGEHADYHREGDNPDRINAEKVAKVARLAFRTAWIVSETPGRPTFTGVDPNDPAAAFIFER